MMFFIYGHFVIESVPHPQKLFTMTDCINNGFLLYLWSQDGYFGTEILPHEELSYGCLYFICTRIHCIHFVVMTLVNVPSLQMWSKLGAVSQRTPVNQSKQSNVKNKASGQNYFFIFHDNKTIKNLKQFKLTLRFKDMPILCEEIF